MFPSDRRVLRKGLKTGKNVKKQANFLRIISVKICLTYEKEQFIMTINNLILWRIE
jgi:hypothetical protein